MSSLIIRSNDIVINQADQNVDFVRKVQERFKEVPPKNNCCDKVTKCFKDAGYQVWDGTKHVIEFFAHAVGTHDNIQSICKFGKSAISFAKYAIGESEGFNNLKAELEVVDAAVDVADLFVKVKELVVPTVDIDNEKRILFKQKGVTKWKILSKAFGTVSTGMGAVKFFMDVGILKFARLSAYLDTIPVFKVVLQFSPFRVVKDSVTILSASLAIVDHSIGVKKHIKASLPLKLRLEKWKAKDELRTYLTSNQADKEKILRKQLTPQEFRDKTVQDRERIYKEKLEMKYLSAKKDLEVLNIKPKNLELSPGQKWEVVKGNYENPELREANKVKWDNKLLEKSKNFSNKIVSRNKEWLGIAFQVTKVAAVIIGLLGVFASLYTVVPFLVVLTTMWFVVSSIGMARLYYGFKHLPKAEPAKA